MIYFVSMAVLGVYCTDDKLFSGKSPSLKGLLEIGGSTKNLLANKQLQRLGQIQGIVI